MSEIVKCRECGCDMPGNTINAHYLWSDCVKALLQQVATLTEKVTAFEATEKERAEFMQRMTGQRSIEYMLVLFGRQKEEIATLTEQHEKQLNDAAETVNKLAVDITTLTEQLRQANEDAERFAKLLRSKDRDYHKGDGYGLSIAEEELLKLHRARVAKEE